MSRQTTIERAFYTSMASLGLTYVSWPNGPSISPPATSINYSVGIDYSDADKPEMYENAYDRFTGTFTVTIRCPVTTDTGDAPGIRPALQAAESIASIFKRGSVQTYRINSSESTKVFCFTPRIRHRGKVTPEWYSLEVEVPFRADLPPSNFVAGLAPSLSLAPSLTLAPSGNRYV